MKNLETIADELFHKIRGRFPKITVGNEAAEVVNKPKEARFFEFDFANGKKVSVSIDQKALTVMYGQNLFSEDEHVLKSKWFDFLKELRVFAKKRMLNFDTRDITKTNLDKRDYEYLSTEKQMSESKMYGTSRTSYQDVGTARLVVKHAGPVNHENAAGRTQNVHSIYIESDAGERFKYPFRHLNGARAMAMHVSEGGNAYDDFGKHITGLSEELNKLRKFKTYMNRSSVMAEGLSGYMDVVNERLVAVKKTVESLQRKAYYTETFTNFETTVLEEVPEDVSNTWIDELTIRQFNEELKGVFPYVYNLVKEANKVEEVSPEELLGEGGSEADEQMIDSWYDEVVGAITNRNITFPIAELKIEKIVDVVADDWGDQGPSEDVVLSIINGENDQTTQDTMEAGSDEISRDEVHNYAAKVLPAIADKIMSGKYSEDQVISLLLKKGMLDSKEFDFSGALVPTTNEASTEDTSYSIKGKSEEANAELARIANVDEWETDPEEHNQAAIESWHDEVVSAITDRNITFPIADNEIQKIADDVVDDWSNGNGPDEHTILSIIDNENDQVNQDQKDEATLEHEATLEAIRNISFR